MGGNGTRRKYLKLMISLAVTAGLFFLFARSFPLSSVAAAFHDLRWGWVGAALCAYAASTFIRVRRFRVMGISILPLTALVQISYLHYFLSNLLPLRSGELAFVYLLNKDRGAPLSVNIASLLVVRMFDFLAIVVWFFIALVVLFPDRIAAFDPMTLGALLVLAILIFLLLMLLWMRAAVGKMVYIALKPFERRHPDWKETWTRFWNDFGLSVDRLKNRHALYSIAWQSLAGWLCIYFITACFMAALGTPLGFWESTFITSFPPIASLIPLGTVGNFGTVETGWTVGLLGVGIPLEQAVPLSVALHILTILLQAVTALQAWVWRKMRRTKTVQGSVEAPAS